MTKICLSGICRLFLAFAVLAATMLPAAPAHADWPQAMDGAEVLRTVTAPNGDIFIAGTYSGETHIGTVTLNAIGMKDVFVARLDAAGRVLWAKSAGGQRDVLVHGLTLDNANNAYIVGSYYGTAYFGGETISGNIDHLDGYVARITADGSWQWVRRVEGTGDIRVEDVVVFPGNASQVPQEPDTLVVTGGFTKKAQLFGAGNTSITLNHGKSEYRGFLAMLQTDGSQWLWATKFSGDVRYDTGKRLLLDNEKRLHLIGEKAFSARDLVDQTFSPGSSLPSGWTVNSNGGRAHFISSLHALVLYLEQHPTPGLVLNRGPVNVATPTLDASGHNNMSIEWKAVRGGTVAMPSSGSIDYGSFSYSTYLTESPDHSNEYLALEYQNESGAWIEVERFSPDGANHAQSADHTLNLLSSDPGFFHANLKFRMRLNSGSGSENDWWFVKNLTAASWGSEAFIRTVTNVSSAGTISWSSEKRFSGSTAIHDVALWTNGSNTELGVVGEFSGDVSFEGSGCHPGSVADSHGGFVSVLTVNNGGYGCKFINSTGGASARAVAGDASQVYVAGGFQGTLQLGGTDIVTQGNDHDVFIAALRAEGDQWKWLTGGSEAGDNPPAQAGGPGEDMALSLATSLGGQLYVAGRFEALAQFGPIGTVQSDVGAGGFITKLGTDGRFSQPETWPVGVPITPPPGANVDSLLMVPEFYLDGQQIQATGNDYRWFTWVHSAADGHAKLIPLQSTPEVEIHWRVSSLAEDPARVISMGAGAWPTRACIGNEIPGVDAEDGCYQSHVVGAPVNVKPSEYQIVGDPVTPDSGGSGATIDSGVFNAERSGFSVIVYVHGPAADTGAYPTYVEVVRSLPYRMTPGFQDNVVVEIGKKITHPLHEEPGVTGWVINELAYYDGHGNNAAYNRSARQGAIIPVNRYSASRPQDFGRDLAVAWYRRNGKGVYWASHAVRYEPRWPYDPDRIVIASEQGSEVFGQALLKPTQFPQAHIYVQNDFSQPGYNPNDEHALMAPSTTGSGYDAVFALRSDFGGENDPAAASDPYVLLKYYNNSEPGWNYKIYKVQATNSQYNRFRYSGVAGTTVSPPYPVRLLPGCSDTFVDGQAAGEPAPAPFFQDHKNQLWAKSAGVGKVHYYYPMQPGFYQDNNYDDVNDYQAGECTPWLARLPESEGGSDSHIDPISVQYDISWPENPPLLIAGETLLSPKRGLPDIYNQAAVEIVYDDRRDTIPDAGPADTLAQLIDPLNPRWVRLPVLPPEVASEMRTDGNRNIIGSSDGTMKMPASLGERMYYDSLNQRLVFHGVFDSSGAGDPKLLLNVMSKRERVLLKKLDGGDGTEESNFEGDCINSSGCSWDQAVEALYRLSRNPSNIEKVCRASLIGEDRERTCTDLDSDLSPDELLIAYQDPDDNGILQPLPVLGGGAALTAGAATSSGYMTVAFNNHESLGALPVSLEVIYVGCLESDIEPPATEPAIRAPYQGQINVISPDNVFDEQLVLRHSGDFGGNPDQLQFEWFFHPDADGTPPMPLPSPETGQMHGWVQFPVADPNGAVEISIEGANIQTLSDNWYLSRYRGLSACGNNSQWSLWAGQPGSTPVEPRAQLAEGWVKRVLDRLNPFEARVQNFGESATNNFTSMLIQLGERYSGPVALNNDPDNLNGMGLIEAYTTVMRRALQLSADSTPPIDYGPANNAVLLVASRLVNFYTLLGNEAYADAQDPTIGIDSGESVMNLNPSIFTFQNQLESTLDEELVLLRGRDDSHGPVAASPVYNRLFWNFTRNDGEVAYALSYNISDQNDDGVIDEYDARIMFPQGHGDAWGHYLTATKTYYQLLKHKFFTWNPQSEAVLVAGVPINVDYLDERQFAQTAVAKARTGAEIVDLTYRKAYVEDPNGQWQGYEDTKPGRAWGLSEWGRRAGMGAYFDWATANAILPEQDDNPEHVGIQRIERANISELNEIAAHYDAIQQQVDKADAGLNPLGLAHGVVPFDIDPAELVQSGKTQFEQVWTRAMGALDNAFRLWEHANQLNNQLRRIQNGSDAQAQASAEQEVSFANRLIEIFGYPYADDIGPGGTYPAGYDGPDLYHYMYVDAPELYGTPLDFDGGLNDGQFSVAKIEKFTGFFGPSDNGMGFFNADPIVLMYPFESGCDVNPTESGCPLGDKPAGEMLPVEYHTIDSPDFGFWFTVPPEWTSKRRAPGRLQQVLHQMFMARVSLQQAILEYDDLRGQLLDQIETVQAVFDVHLDNLVIAKKTQMQLQSMSIAAGTMENAAIAARRAGEATDFTFKASSECVPKSLIVGLAGGGDTFSAVRCSLQTAGNISKFALDTAADALDIAANSVNAARDDVSNLADIETMINDINLEMFNVAGEVDSLMRREPMLRAELYARTEAIKQLQGDYLATLAEGLRVYDQLLSFRRNGAAAVQEERYKDMAFRIFRNEALQKYRASFDLAARYVYLAAAAYDYETNLLGTDSRAGQEFLTRVVKQRSLGQMLDGEPIAGSPGLADTMAQLKLNFGVLKSQMGFNNPQEATKDFSLRHELFRIPSGPEGDERWRQVLESAKVHDLWQVPEFRRLARPFAPESAGAQPGLVLEFTTNVSYGLNFFGWDKGEGDSSYDSSRFATRIRAVATAFSNYGTLPLANDPNVYLIPVGADVLRAPDPLDFSVRDWQIVDQVIPVPIPVGPQDLERFDWNPGDTLSGPYQPLTEVRRHPQMTAFNYVQPFDNQQLIDDGRLIGRSVWNRRWLLIIPGGSFLTNPNEGLDTFIHGTKGPGGVRDGNGVSDIRVLLKTYSYSGS